jgi:hypothetical protein
MKTEQVIQRLANEVSKPSSEHVYLKKEDAKRILERVNSLEAMAAELLRSVHGNTGIVVQLPYKSKP